MDGIRPEIQKALDEMNWEDRLEKARARRKSVLERRATADEGVCAPDVPIVISVDEVERLRFGTDPEDAAPVTETRLAARSGWMRIANIGLGATAWLVIAVLGIWLGSQLLTSEPVGVEQVLTAPPQRNAAPETVAAEPGPTAQGGEEREAAVPLPEAPVALSELAVEIAPPMSMGAPDVPGVSGAATEAPAGLAALGMPRMDGVPEVGDPPVLASGVSATPRRADVPPLVVAEAPPMLPSFGSMETDVGTVQLLTANSASRSASGGGDHLRDSRRLPVVGDRPSIGGRIPISDPERPELLASLPASPVAAASEDSAGLALASTDDDLPARSGPGSLSRAPASGAVAAADLDPPRPVIPGAEDLSIWIFAASGVDADDVETAESTIAGFDLPVRAVNRVSYRISENQVRFYDVASDAVARRLAAEIGATPRDFTGAASSAPPGTIEIYLAGEAAEAPPSRPAARAAAPARRPQLSEAERLRNSVLSRLRSAGSD